MFSTYQGNSYVVLKRRNSIALLETFLNDLNAQTKNLLRKICALCFSVAVTRIKKRKRRVFLRQGKTTTKKKEVKVYCRYYEEFVAVRVAEQVRNATQVDDLFESATVQT